MNLLIFPAAYLLYKIGEIINTDNLLDQVYQKYKGTPYLWGGTTPQGFDCSGFTQYVYKNYFNTVIPRTAAQQAAAAIQTNNPRPGDLVFFTHPGQNNAIKHVGIYYQDGKFIHSGSSNGIEIADLNNNYYKTRFVKFGTYQ
jgi:cell wall-associated NlpC family hydrolase